MIVILIFLSILPVFLLARYIYNTDFDKEPKQLLTRLFLLGVGSTAVTTALTKILVTIIPFFGYEIETLDVISLIPYIFLGVACIEESSKWFFVYKFGYHHYEFNHAYDGIVYAVFVSLGFACLENILYVFEGGVATAIARAITAVPGHACYGVWMGFYLGIAKTADKHKNQRLSKKSKVKSLLYPIILHGIYDYLIFAGTSISFLYILFIIFVILLFSETLKKVQQLARVRYDIAEEYYAPIIGSRGNITYRYQYCPICGEKVVGRFCIRCGHNHVGH